MAHLPAANLVTAEAARKAVAQAQNAADLAAQQASSLAQAANQQLQIVGDWSDNAGQLSQLVQELAVHLGQAKGDGSK